MGAKNILRVHGSIGKCFENDLSKHGYRKILSFVFNESLKFCPLFPGFMSKLSRSGAVFCIQNGKTSRLQQGIPRTDG